MAKAIGTIRLREGGFTSGYVGDLPIDEAIAAVHEGRVKLDVAQRESDDIAMLFDALGVRSLEELAMLVAIGREHTPSRAVWDGPH